MATADWWRHGVIYQIYPRSFADGDGDGVGDLPGITARLDHLNDGTPGSLGVEAIWLSPFYPSPMADFGYDVADYTGVHPDFGTLEDFDRLVAEAHARGIRVIIDLVPNHTSDQHPWFLESRSSRDSPKRDWYVWADSKPDGSPPNNWKSSFPRASRAWTFDQATGQWYLHSFLPQQPDLNWWNPQVRAAMDEVMRFWLDRGVDGFRIDVAHKMARDPALRDNPLVDLGEGEEQLSGPELARRTGWQERFDQNWPEVHEILRRFRRTLEKYDDRMAVGEVYLLDLAVLADYYGQGADELHLVHNFVFLHQPWKAEAFRAIVDEFWALLPEGAWPAWFLGNHDHSRVASRYDEPGGTPASVPFGTPRRASDRPASDRRAERETEPGGSGNGPARARVAAMMLLTLRGTPFLYQGEELGMTDTEIPPDRVIDIDGRDPERTPMQWDASPGAGFTTGEPWLPIPDSAREVNVAAQREDPRSMLSLYRRLLWYRKGSPALHRGRYRSLGDTPDGLYAYLRTEGDERLLVALNFTGRPLRYDAGGLAGSGRLELATDPDRPTGGKVDLAPLEVGPDQGLVIRVR